MPRGPKGERRPADAIGNAIMIAKIATGEIDDLTTDDGKNAAAVALGRMGRKRRELKVCLQRGGKRSRGKRRSSVGQIVLSPFQIRAGIWKISWR